MAGLAIESNQGENAILVYRFYQNVGGLAPCGFWEGIAIKRKTLADPMSEVLSELRETRDLVRSLAEDAIFRSPAFSVWSLRSGVLNAILSNSGVWLLHRDAPVIDLSVVTRPQEQRRDVLAVWDRKPYRRSHLLILMPVSASRMRPLLKPARQMASSRIRIWS